MPKLNKSLHSRKELTLWDWAFFLACAAVGYFFFTHADIVITAERSFLMLKGHVTDFYSASASLSGDLGANYMPTTFWMYAIWNIPLQLLGMAPAQWNASDIYQIGWYKLLPTLFYFASAFLAYKICTEEFHFDKMKSKIIVYSFMTFPLAFFSQFCFYQYDVFTLFFMMMGMWYYFKEKQTNKDFYLFALYFSIAVSCKYYAIIIFLVLLLLRHKDIFKIVVGSAVSIGLVALESALYLVTDGTSFVQQVFGFGALGYVDSSQLTLGLGKVSLFPIFMCVLLVWCYVTKVKDHFDLISYSMYFCCGACFGLFGLITWHPQWLLFGSFFWTVSTFMNKNSKAFLWLDTAWIVVFYGFVVNYWHNWVDQNLFVQGGLRGILAGKDLTGILTMADIYRLGGMQTTLLSLLVAILLINFVFKHPRYCVSPQEIQPNIAAIRVRTAVTVLAFFLPAFTCLFTMLS